MNKVDSINLLAAAGAYLELAGAGVATVPPPQAAHDPLADSGHAGLTEVGGPRTANITDFTVCTRRFARSPNTHADAVEKLISQCDDYTAPKLALANNNAASNDSPKQLITVRSAGRNCAV